MIAAAFQCVPTPCSWSQSDQSTDKSVNTTVESVVSLRWHRDTLGNKLEALLLDATTTSERSFVSDPLKHLVQLVRQASVASMVVAPWTSPFGTGGGGGSDGGTLCDWLTRADMVVSHSARGRGGYVEERNMTSISTWLDLIHPEGDFGETSRGNAGLQACQWACKQQNYLLARRILVKESQKLALLPNASNKQQETSSINLHDLHRAVCSPTFSVTTRLNQIQRLLFSDCLARLLWSSCNEHDTSGMSLLTNKLAAFDVLSRGLRTALLDDMTQDTAEYSMRCFLSTRAAIRLFDWLEDAPEASGTNSDADPTWAHLVYRESVKNKVSLSYVR